MSRHSVVSVSPSANTNENQGDSTGRPKRIKSRAETFQDGYMHNHHHRAHGHNDGEGTGGWAGIVALVCACTFYYAPLAILFGAIGMQRGRRNRRLARGAFIAGIVEVSVVVILIAIAAVIATSYL